MYGTENENTKINVGDHAESLGCIVVQNFYIAEIVLASKPRPGRGSNSMCVHATFHTGNDRE